MIDRRLAGRLQLVPPPAPVSLDAPRLTYWQRLALGVALIVSIALMASCSPEPVTQPVQAQVVRMLDITIRDSNTTNRRQRFECRPVEGR